MESNESSAPPPAPPRQPPDEYNLRATLEAAQEEIIGLLRKRREIELRINTLQSDLVHIAALCHVELPDPVAQLGLTDIVRWIVAQDTFPVPGKPRKAITLRQIIENAKRYQGLSGLENLPGNVTTVVKRLVKSKDIVETPVAGVVGPGFVWGGGLPPMPPDLEGWLKDLRERLK